jgi:hypothetical protein
MWKGESDKSRKCIHVESSQYSDLTRAYENFREGSDSHNTVSQVEAMRKGEEG